MREAFRAAGPLLAMGTALLPAAAAAGDETAGAYLAATCAACHQSQAPAGSAIPAIAGLDEAQVIAALQAYRSGERTDAVMQAIATTLSDAELAAVAHALATQGQPQ